MTWTNINDSGTEQPRTEVCGGTWGRPTSNKGHLKAEMLMMMMIF